jgi:hypothetical protein
MNTKRHFTAEFKSVFEKRLRLVGRLSTLGSMSNPMYPTDLTDCQWEYIKDLVPAATLGVGPAR